MSAIGDLQRKSHNVTVVPTLSPVVPVSDFSDPESTVNSEFYGGKKRYAVTTSSTGYLIASTGVLKDSPWVLQGSSVLAPISAPSDSGNNSLIVGDMQRKVRRSEVSAVPFPYISFDELMSAESAINTPELSGKQLGAAVLDKDSMSLYVALGSNSTDGWINQTSGYVTIPV